MNQVIAKQLDLTSKKGFSLCFKIADRTIFVPEKSFFFDSIRQIISLVVRCSGKKPEDYLKPQYQLFFLRKVWINCLPGHDKVADEKFHFYQEVDKYLQGYHRITRKDAIQLAILIYRSKHGTNNKELNVMR